MQFVFVVISGGVASEQSRGMLFLCLILNSIFQ